MGIELGLALISCLIVALVPIGVALIWVARAIAMFRRDTRWDTFVVGWIGWAVLVAGLTVIAASTLHGAVVSGLLLLAVVALVAWGWKRRGDRLQLLWTIGSAAHAGLPISPAVRCLAHERRGRQGKRLTRFADLLDQGVALPRAVAQSVGRTTSDGDIAIQVHWHSLAMEDLLRFREPDDEATDKMLMKVSEIAFYFLVLLAVFVGMCIYLRLRVLPILEELLEGQRIPWTMSQFTTWTGWLIGADFTLASWAVIGLTVFLLGVSGIAMMLHHLQRLPPDLPLISKLGRPLDRARILASVALVVERGQPVVDMFEFLAANYPKSIWRHRLGRAAAAARNGEAWSASLFEARVLTRGELSLIRAAERAGNVAWALREVAAAIRRRYLERLRWLHAVAAPAVVLFWGVAVALVVLAVFMPICQLITEFI